MMKKVLSCLICALMVMGLVRVSVSASEGVAEGTQKAYVIGDDWGPAVSKTVIELDKTINSNSVNKDSFTVEESKEVYDWSDPGAGKTTVSEPAARTVLNAYTSDANGNQVSTDSNYVTIEMYVSPSEGSPFIYNLATGFNTWCTPYNLYVSLNDEAVLMSGDEMINALNVTASIDVAGEGKICPQGEVFNMKSYTTSNGTNYSYAEYVPAEDDKKNALVIWLHGAGEGGKDPYIDILGNEVTALAGEQFQGLFEGAYILTPQSPTMWMDDGTGAYQNGDKGSCYADSLFEMIDAYVKANDDIDPDRVIIGGCSNGGYMTMEMILKHPDYFAAAYPICEAYQDQYITDEQIEAIKDMPIWFTYAKNDGTVNPGLCSEATIERLLAAGATNVHVSAFEDVHDTTGRFTDAEGNPYQYDGHWSWTYFDNNECYDENGVNAWQWLANQTNAELVYASGTQKAYVIGDDWGPAVSKTVIELDKTINSNSVNKDSFTVEESKEVYDWSDPGAGKTTVSEPAARTVLNAYTSDANGNQVSTDSNYVTIEMYVSPSEGSPFIYNLATGFNTWCTPYNLYVSLNDEAVLMSGDEMINALNVTASIDVAGEGKICPQGEVFNMKSYTTSNGTNYSYAEYVPAEDDKKNALVIWLHGAGEGGKDPYIDILGNEVTALAGEQFQGLFEGAYILTPQSPTMWMDDGTGAYQNGDKGSCYADSLFEMIDAYVKANDDIDPDRVIIGGCSNGGYMTMEMILKHPDYFAAAYPICEAYQDQYITDEQIEAIKDMPIWFTYAKNDGTVNPGLCSEATIERLLAAGATNVHVSAFEDVHDTTGRFTDAEGNPYQYDGHWSWTYFDNNECYDENGVNAWQWLAKQTKAVDVNPDVIEPSVSDSNNSITTGDDVNFAGLGMLIMLTAAGVYVTRKRV